MGQEAVVVKNGSRLCGTGAARSSSPILQNKAYWEFKLQQAGIWSCGLANPGCDLNRNLGTDLNSWCLTQDTIIMWNSMSTSTGKISIALFSVLKAQSTPYFMWT